MTSFSNLVAALNARVVDDLGESEGFKIIHRSGIDQEAGGIFDSRHFEVLGEGEVGISALVTTLAVDLAETGDVSTAERVERLLTGQLYRVKDVRPDGLGMAVLELEVID